MSTVLISSDGTLDESAPCLDMLWDAGFEVRLVKDRRFAHGLGSEEETIQMLCKVAAVIAWGEAYTERVLAALPKLCVIARAGVGFDQVDIAAATARGVVVTITPNANHEAVAEHTLTLLLALAKWIVPNDRAMRAGGWPSNPIAPVRGKTLGIIGLGRIGRSTAVRALALRMNVIAAEIYPDKEFADQHDIEFVDLDTLLARADYVSLHCPLTDETCGMIDGEKFAKMKPGSVLINTARGRLVVEGDLVDALKSGHLGGAGLDAFEQQPTDANNPLFQFDNVVVCPHIAGNDTLAMENMGIEAAQCIIDLSRGKWPGGAVVNDELKEKWKW